MRRDILGVEDDEVYVSCPESVWTGDSVRDKRGLGPINIDPKARSGEQSFRDWAENLGIF